MPLRAACGNVIYVQDQLREPFVEHARLHLKRRLRGQQIGFNPAQCTERGGRQPQRERSRSDGAGQREDCDGHQHSLAADTQGG